MPAEKYVASSTFAVKSSCHSWRTAWSTHKKECKVLSYLHELNIIFCGHRHVLSSDEDGEDDDHYSDDDDHSDDEDHGNHDDDE
jgi:hypothetical protein